MDLLTVFLYGSSVLMMVWVLIQSKGQGVVSSSPRWKIVSNSPSAMVAWITFVMAVEAVKQFYVLGVTNANLLYAGCASVIAASMYSVLHAGAKLNLDAIKQKCCLDWWIDSRKHLHPHLDNAANLSSLSLIKAYEREAVAEVLMMGEIGLPVAINTPFSTRYLVNKVLAQGWSVETKEPSLTPPLKRFVIALRRCKAGAGFCDSWRHLKYTNHALLYPKAIQLAPASDCGCIVPAKAA